MKRFQVFDTTDAADIATYEGVLNNSLCIILEKEVFTKKEKFFNEDGAPTHSTETPLLVVHWEEKEV